MIIKQAELEDAKGILALLKANHISSLKEDEKKEGFVTTNLTSEQLERLIVQEKGITIAKDDQKVLAFAMAASWDFWKEWPFFAYMIEQLPQYTYQGEVLTTKNSYQYGPVCIDKSMRGSGLFEAIFWASLESKKDVYPIMATFINQINPRSYAAHTKKVYMEQSGTFAYNQNNYYLMACSTSKKQEQDQKR